MFDTVGIIAKQGDTRVSHTLSCLVDTLIGRPVQVLLDIDSSVVLAREDIETVTRDELGRRCQLAIVVAGDGTFLGAARSLVGYDISLLGINLGRLGFLTDLMPSGMTEVLSDILSGKYVEDRRLLLRAELIRDGKTVFSATALNDIVLHKWNIARLIEFETHIDGRLLNSQRSDGLIVATPTGSTAYALSGGGPILHPDLNVIVLVPICPHTLSSRPIVIDGASRIDITVCKSLATGAQVTSDGQDGFEVRAGDRLKIERHARTVRLIHPAAHDHYATLRAKLHWGREF